MRTNALLKISLATAIVGLILLFFLSERLEPKLISISQIDERMLDSYVKVMGKINSVRETEGLYILDLQDSSSRIDVVVFKQNQKFNFQKGQQVEVIGKVSEFRFKLQIEATGIRGLS